MMLSSANLGLPQGQARKLAVKWLGPFSITERVGQNAYKLALPRRFKIHPVFNADKLKPYRESERFPSAPMRPPPLPEFTDGQHYEVESILSRKRVRSRYQYLVKWAGYPEEEATWEPLSNLTNVMDLVRDFDASCDRAGPSSAV